MPIDWCAVLQSLPCCEYKSIRKIRVKNRKLAAIYWITILGVFLYVALYTIWNQKGYQSFDEVVGTTSTKVKGTGSVGDFDEWRNTTIYDAIDLVFPSVETDALFVTSAIVDTPGQTRGICDGNDDVDDCNNDNDCIENTYSSNSQGIYTGNCGTNNKCEVYGWCPLEDDNIRYEINNVGNFSIFIQINIHFPTFDVSRTNTLNSLQSGYNLFTIDDLVLDATENEYTASDLALSGAIILFESNWDCDLDGGDNECDPKFDISRLDNQTDSVTSGFNFRTAIYDDNSTIRNLKKLYGIRIVFLAAGSAGQFDFSALTITFGAGLAYLGIASIVADVFLEHFLPESDILGKAKVALVRQSIVKTELEAAKSKSSTSNVNTINPNVVDGDHIIHDPLTPNARPQIPMKNVSYDERL